MNYAASSNLQSRDPSEPMLPESEPMNGEDRTAQPEIAATLGQGKERRTRAPRRGWFGGDERHSVAFYGEYYR